MLALVVVVAVVAEAALVLLEANFYNACGCAGSNLWRKSLHIGLQQIGVAVRHGKIIGMHSPLRMQTVWQNAPIRLPQCAATTRALCCDTDANFS
jgi:hypothetical protein